MSTTTGHAMCQETAQALDHLLVCYLKADEHPAWHYDTRGLGAYWLVREDGEVVTHVGLAEPPSDTVPGTPNLPAPLGTSSGALDLDALEAGVVHLRSQLEGALATAVAEMRAARGAVVSQEDTYELVRRLAHAQSVLSQWAGAFTAASKACTGHIEDELITAVGEQDGIPVGRMVVPTGGQEYVVSPAYRAGTDSWDVHSIIGVVADVAAAEHAASGCSCNWDGNPETYDGPAQDCVVHGDPATVAREVAGNAGHKLLGLLASPKWASTKVDALRRSLAGNAEGDRLASVLGQARNKGERVYTGVTVELEEAKARRRS